MLLTGHDSSAGVAPEQGGCRHGHGQLRRPEAGAPDQLVLVSVGRLAQKLTIARIISVREQG